MRAAFKLGAHKSRPVLSGMCRKHHARHLHIPVLLEESLSYIPKSSEKVLDMTFGGGGHTKAILKRCASSTVFALDRDRGSFSTAKMLANAEPRLCPLHGKFSEVHQLLARKGIGPGSLDAVLFDIGASSLQFDSKDRGFSISQKGPLDMRMNQDEDFGAFHIINYVDEERLSTILRKYGEEKLSRPIAKAIVDSRNAFGAITNTAQLAKVVDSAFEYTNTGRQDKLMRFSHAATKTFQALRIFVNNEMNELHNGLELSHQLLRPGGVCVVISFHSLEDRIVKRHFHGIDIDVKAGMSLAEQTARGRRIERDLFESALQKKWTPVSKSVMLPSDAEIEANPRARSAKLRAAIKN